MKTTMIMRNTANPRRTTLAHLQDADELTTEAVAAEEAQNSQTANPQRTILVETLSH